VIEIDVDVRAAAAFEKAINERTDVSAVDHAVAVCITGKSPRRGYRGNQVSEADNQEQAARHKAIPTIGGGEHHESVTSPIMKN
jgi:hypothetical protein